MGLPVEIVKGEKIVSISRISLSHMSLKAGNPVFRKVFQDMGETNLAEAAASIPRPWASCPAGPEAAAAATPLCPRAAGAAAGGSLPRSPGAAGASRAAGAAWAAWAARRGRPAAAGASGAAGRPSRADRACAAKISRLSKLDQYVINHATYDIGLNNQKIYSIAGHLVIAQIYAIYLRKGVVPPTNCPRGKQLYENFAKEV